MKLGDEEADVSAGDSVVIPPGTPHKLWEHRHRAPPPESSRSGGPCVCLLAYSGVVKQKAQRVGDWLWRVVSVGRSIVLFGAVVGAAFLVRQLESQDEDLYPAFLKSLGAMFAVMIVLGVVREFWGDRRVSSAQGPGGTGGVGFEDESKATQYAVAEVNTRITKQMEDVNKRLYDLERLVFKANESGDDNAE
jgi:hypothetical protein